MNRPIKFRAWDKETKIMEYDILFSGVRNLLQHRLENPKVFKVIQFTGLKDKNGKEIYEGDICKCNESSLLKKRFGEHETNMPHCWCNPKKTAYSNGNMHIAHNEEMTGKIEQGNGCWLVFGLPIFNFIDPALVVHIEVIGNIYENPNLLNNHGE